MALSYPIKPAHDPTDLTKPFPELLLLPDGRYACDSCDAAVEREKLVKVGEGYLTEFWCPHCSAQAKLRRMM